MNPLAPLPVWKPTAADRLPTALNRVYLLSFGTKEVSETSPTLILQYRIAGADAVTFAAFRAEILVNHMQFAFRPADALDRTNSGTSCAAVAKRGDDGKGNESGAVMRGALPAQDMCLILSAKIF